MLRSLILSCAPYTRLRRPCSSQLRDISKVSLLRERDTSTSTGAVHRLARRGLPRKTPPDNKVSIGSDVRRRDPNNVTTQRIVN